MVKERWKLGEGEGMTHRPSKEGRVQSTSQALGGVLSAPQSQARECEWQGWVRKLGRKWT